MLETILGLALLPFALATVIAIIATAYLAIAKGWKFIIFGVVSFAAVISLLARAEWYYVFGFGMLAIFILLWAIGEFDEPSKGPVQDQ